MPVSFWPPVLLSKSRPCRMRIPSNAVARATSPVTIQSVKKRRVQYGQACDREFRYFATQFARCSVKEAPWAAAYLAAVRPQCDKASQACRRLANRRIAIIWRLWMDRIKYDGATHLRNRLTNRQRSWRLIAPQISRSVTSGTGYSTPELIVSTAPIRALAWPHAHCAIWHLTTCILLHTTISAAAIAPGRQPFTPLTITP